MKKSHLKKPSQRTVPTRPIIASFLRGHSLHPDLPPRRYARLDTSIPRVTQILLMSGEPGDLCELSYELSGLSLGVVIVHALGKIDMTWTTKEGK